jgi:phage tail sheath protein FI
MPTTEFFHGTRVFEAGQTTRPISVGEYSTIGAILVSDDADPAKYPLDHPVTVFTNDATMKAAAGVAGNADAIFDAIDDQGVGAQVEVVRVAKGAGGSAQAILEATIANIVGSSSAGTGVHAWKNGTSMPKLLIAPGYTSQRIANAKNPVMAEFEGLASRFRAIAIGDTAGTTKEADFAYRQDFPDAKRVYLFSPGVKVFRAGQTITEPGSGRVAGLFVKRDKQVGGPFESPSNQAMGGITGASRPIAYYTGEPDSEANWLNERRIATLKKGYILWGNRTCALDPLDTFVNVVRTTDMIDEAVMNAFDWAIDRNQSVPLAVAVLQSLDAFLDELKAKGAILGGRPWFERDINTNEAMAAGVLRIEYDREPAAPMEDLQFAAARNVGYYAELRDGILTALTRLPAGE